MNFESFYVVKKFTEEMTKEYGSVSDVDVETSLKIDTVFLDNVVVEKRRERGISWN